MTWIQTHNRKAFEILNPRPDDITIEDIAHALSNQCRFTGHTKYFYSVAQHSFYASLYVSPRNAIAAFLHDASEAYLCDLATPVKKLLPDYYTLEFKIMRAIAEKFDFMFPFAHEIKEIDLRLLITERDQLVGGELQPWGAEFNVEPLPLQIEPIMPHVIKDMFLFRSKELGITT